MQLPGAALARLRRRPLLALEVSLLLAAIGTFELAGAALEPLTDPLTDDLSGDPARLVRNVTRSLVLRVDDQAEERMHASLAHDALSPTFPGMCLEVLEGGTSTTRVDGERVLLSSGTRMLRGGRAPGVDSWVRVAYVLDGPTAGSYVLEPGSARDEARTREHCTDARDRWARVAVAGDALVVEVPTI